LGLAAQTLALEEFHELPLIDLVLPDAEVVLLNGDQRVVDGIQERDLAAAGGQVDAPLVC
jgi:hypothetical protein